MNFFKSILLDDPDPPKSLNSDQPGPNSPIKPPHQDANPGAADGWSFGGLIKTLATRSESVIETYRKDLEEFGSGLKKESDIIREAASRAVKDLPASLEAGTSAAQGVLDGVLKSTAEIISKETQVFGSDGEPETPETNSGRYSWFESQVSAVQGDPNTFCEEPEDVEEYKKWKLRFDLDEKKGEIEDMVGENGNLEGVYERVVPSVVDHETFWCRYFYRVDKLKQQESVRANLVKRAISADEDDDLSWDVDDDDVVVEKDGNESKIKSGVEVKEVKSDEVDGVKSDEKEKEVKSDEREVKSDEREVKSDEVGVKSDEKEKEVKSDEREVKSDEVDRVKSDEKVVVKSDEVGESKSVEKEKEEVDGLKSEEREKEVKSDVVVVGGLKSEEKMKSEESGDEKVGVVEKGESGKKGDVSEEEDLGWDEIEDIGSGDENKKSKTSDGGRVNREELRKQLSVEDDEDEDLSWDIEDDDDDNVPVKSKS